MNVYLLKKNTNRNILILKDKTKESSKEYYPNEKKAVNDF